MELRPSRYPVGTEVRFAYVFGAAYGAREPEWYELLPSQMQHSVEVFPGLNHSGRLGPINFLNGPMGIANADRTMGYIRVLAEFISQNEYQDVVQMFGVINEPLMGIIGRDPLDRL